MKVFNGLMGGGAALAALVSTGCPAAIHNAAGASGAGPGTGAATGTGGAGGAGTGSSTAAAGGAGGAGGQAAACTVPTKSWAKALASDGKGTTVFSAVDKDGNIYLTGGVFGTLDFGPGCKTLQSSDPSAKTRDVYVAKIDGAGVCKWSARFGDASHDQTAYAIAVSSTGIVAITGINQGEVDFGKGPITKTLLVATFDSMTGDAVWSRGLGDGWGTGVAVQGDGSVWIAGKVSGGDPVTIGQTSAADQGGFIARLDPGGNSGWVKGFKGVYNEGHSVAVGKDGNAVATGTYFGDVINFGGPSCGDLASPAPGKHAGFVVKLKPGGDCVWSERFGGDQDAGGAQIATDGSSEGVDVLLAGNYNGNAKVTFEGCPALPASSGMFVAKLSGKDGQCSWNEFIGTGAYPTQVGVAAGNGGDVLLTNGFAGNVDLGCGPLKSEGYNDVLVARLESHGVGRWTDRFGDENGQVGNSIAEDPAGNVVVSGSCVGNKLKLGSQPIDCGAGGVFLLKYGASASQAPL